MKNLIAFRKHLVIGELTNTLKSNEPVLRFQHMLMKYGYMLSKSAFNNLLKMDEEQLTEIYSDIQKYFLETVGNPNAKELEELFYMFANETDQQRSIREAKEQKDLRLKKYAVIYSDNIYTSMQSYCNLVWEAKTNNDVLQVYETTKFTEINYASENEFKKIFTDLVKIGTALTPTDFATVEWFAKEYGNTNIMPSSIPFKENLCMVASLGLDVPVKTATDVLRIATYMSNGTTDLFLPPKMVRENAWTTKFIENPDRKIAQFKKFNRAERRYLLNLLESVADVKEMVMRKGRWIKLGEILHPGEYSKKFPLSAKAFKLLRETKVKSWYGEVDSAFSKSFSLGLTKLSERPGEFVRRLDALLRKNTKTDEILNTFAEIGHNVSTKVLWEVYSHFNNRNVVDEFRSIWIKGARQPVSLPTLNPLNDSIIAKTQKIIIDLITNRFAKLDNLGNVYIDSELRKIPVPTNMRTLQEATKVVIRGTRMPLQTTKKVLRPYIHWTAGVDLDISVAFIDYNNETTYCSYNRMNPHPSVLHSGDVIPKVRGEWAEYIDINLNTCPYKYGLFQVHNFGGGSLDDVGAVVGFMERDNLQSSKKWKPNTIENSFKVSSKGSTVNLFIIDFETKEWILIDEDSTQTPMTGNDGILKYVEGLSKEPKLSVYDVLSMHTEARGSLVEKEEDSDVKFLFDEFSTSYEKIAEYML
jgi:hypothetical protein